MTHDHVDALMVGAGQPDSRSARELTAAGVAPVVLETGHEQGRFVGQGARYGGRWRWPREKTAGSSAARALSPKWSSGSCAWGPGPAGAACPR